MKLFTANRLFAPNVNARATTNGPADANRFKTIDEQHDSHWELPSLSPERELHFHLGYFNLPQWNGSTKYEKGELVQHDTHVYTATKKQEQNNPKNPNTYNFHHLKKMSGVWEVDLDVITLRPAQLWRDKNLEDLPLVRAGITNNHRADTGKLVIYRYPDVSTSHVKKITAEAGIQHPPNNPETRWADPIPAIQPWLSSSTYSQGNRVLRDSPEIAERIVFKALSESTGTEPINENDVYWDVVSPLDTLWIKAERRTNTYDPRDLPNLPNIDGVTLGTTEEPATWKGSQANLLIHLLSRIQRTTNPELPISPKVFSFTNDGSNAAFEPRITRIYEVYLMRELYDFGNPSGGNLAGLQQLHSSLADSGGGSNRLIDGSTTYYEGLGSSLKRTYQAVVDFQDIAALNHVLSLLNTYPVFTVMPDPEGEPHLIFQAILDKEPETWYSTHITSQGYTLRFSLSEV